MAKNRIDAASDNSNLEVKSALPQKVSADHNIMTLSESQQHQRWHDVATEGEVVAATGPMFPVALASSQEAHVVSESSSACYHHLRKLAPNQTVTGMDECVCFSFMFS